MLKKTHRLNRKFLYSVQQSGTNIRHPLISLRAMSNNCGFNRYAVVTSTKIDTRATKRNLLRRKIYSLLVNYPGSSDIILYPTSQVLNFDHAKISTLLDQLLPKTSSSLP